MTTPASALPAPPQTRCRRRAKLSPERLYAENMGLVGLCLKRFPFLAYEAREEAYGAGLLGLWIAAQRFDPAKGFQFSSFAHDYIRGYILRRLKAERQQTRLPCVSLETPVGQDGEGGELADLIADTQAEVPGQALVEMAGFEARIARLPARQQAVIRGVYQDGKTLTEIGQGWGMTKQAAGSVHLLALGKLRGQPQERALHAGA